MSGDVYAGPTHVSEPCAYCTSAERANLVLWEWYAADPANKYTARFTWAGAVRAVAREFRVRAHPVSPRGGFYGGGPSDLVETSEYVALPLCYEEALRHVLHEEEPLRRLFQALADPTVRVVAGAAWSLGGQWALRDHLRAAGAAE